nr:L-alanine-DL-glutamate epimerase [Clostridia bacterium]
MADKIKITYANSSFEQLELTSPFGFKGGSSSFLWNTAALLGSDKAFGIGHGTEGVLWSDSKVFFTSGNLAGSAMMYLMTDRAVRLCEGREFADPSEMLDFLLPEIYEYGKAVTANPELRMTFALDSLVPVDMAMWQLYAKINGISDFDSLIPDAAKPTLSCRHDTLAC